MPLQATSGAASYDAYGGGAPVIPAYIEEVFSTYLYTGNGSTQTINNGIDLAGKGGLVWLKGRSFASNPAFYDTARGVQRPLMSNVTSGQNSDAGGGVTSGLYAFNSNGFSLGPNYAVSINSSGQTFASWTFRKQPKFFDVVTYTGTGANRTVAHNLGSVPGFIIVKRTDAAADWQCYHRSLANTQYMVLNTTDAVATGSTRWNSTTPTSTTFTLGNDGDVNASGSTYVAYLFAHDAGGFGLTGTDNVISCGSFNYNTFPQTVNLDFEPQWLMVKQSDGSGDWIMFDNMRGFTTQEGGTTGIGERLLANTSSAATATSSLYYGGAKGFNLNLPAFGNYIYIAIRRGPMKVPTSGTSVYNGITRTGTGAATNITGAGFPIDLLIQHERATSNNIWTTDRLRGTLSNLDTQSTAAENTNSFFQFDKQDGFGLVGAAANVSGRTMIDWVFRRAPSVFDVVCYTGTGSARTINHNLGLAPEMMIVRQRDGAANWEVYHKTLSAFGTEPANQSRINLNNQNASTVNNQIWNSTTPTSTVFSVGASSDSNSNGGTFVNYLFATCAGVSKVGSYTGTGTTLQIDCGFTGGARFVLIRRQDNTGDWYVWDTARGIVSGNDPYVLLNSANVEVTSTDYIDTYSAGFEISSTAPAAINASGGSYIFLAIA